MKQKYSSQQPIDSIATELVLLDPKDPRACTRLYDMLQELGENSSETDRIRKLAEEAAAVAWKLIFEEYDPPQSGVGELERLVARMQSPETSVDSESTIGALDTDACKSPMSGDESVKLREEFQIRQVTESKEPSSSTTQAAERQRFAIPSDVDVSLAVEFREEALEHIQNAEVALLDLEINPEDKESVNIVFRAFHTIKGVASFLGLRYLTDLAHYAENFLDRARKGKLTLADAYADLAFEALDGLKFLIQDLQDSMARGFGEPCPNYDGLCQTLEHPEETAQCRREETQQERPRLGDILVESGTASLKAVEEAINEQVRGEGSPIGEILVRKGNASAKDVAKALQAQKSQTTSAGTTTQETEGAVKVGTTRLDALINMVGELVIAQAMVSQDEMVRSSTNQNLNRKVGHLAKITRRLQELALLMRMVSVKSTFQKMARLVRDLARKSGKEVVLMLEGEDIELDRNMVEAIADPLVHLIRNSVDHGIESPEERRKCGKPSAGQLVLRAQHEGSGVIITLQDDGRGLDTEKIRKKAIEKKLISADAALSEMEIHRFILQPGFSTAELVTDVSGRGVGMDVVRSNIEALHGTVEISSMAGKGATFTLRFPLTLAIIDGMVVRVGKERYIIPTIRIIESLQPASEQIFTVEKKGEMILLRNHLIPLYRLHRLFAVSGAVQEPTEAILIVAENNTKRCAIMVDKIEGQQQVVIKNLGSLFERANGVSGGAIMGDGRISLILDIDGICAATQDNP